MIGSRVFHNVFGGGVITGKTGTLLTVDFGGDEKKFVYPDVFEKYLESADQELMSQVNSDLQIKRNAHAQAIPLVIQSSPTTPQLRIKKRHKKIERSNVAFKCNYCDGGKTPTCIGFNGVCSDSVLRYRFTEKTGTFMPEAAPQRRR